MLSMKHRCEQEASVRRQASRLQAIQVQTWGWTFSRATENVLIMQLLHHNTSLRRRFLSQSWFVCMCVYMYMHMKIFDVSIRIHGHFHKNFNLNLYLIHAHIHVHNYAYVFVFLNVCVHDETG